MLTEDKRQRRIRALKYQRQSRKLLLNGRAREMKK